MENFYSSYSNPEGGEDTLRMDQFDAQLPMETRRSSKMRGEVVKRDGGMRTGVDRKLILF